MRLLMIVPDRDQGFNTPLLADWPSPPARWRHFGHLGTIGLPWSARGREVVR
jgi:hypothetical protein